MRVFSSTGWRRLIRPALAASAALCLAGGIGVMVGAGRSAADSALSVTPTSGDSSTSSIRIAIPTSATCSGDDTGGKNQYQIFPYIIPASEAPSSIRYTHGQITTLPWFTDAGGDTLGQFVPGVGNHSVTAPTNLDWQAYQTNSDYGVSGADLQPGAYNVGLICIDIGSTNNPTGAPDIPHNGDASQDGSTNFWNTQFTFTTHGSTAAGPDFTWTAVPNSGSGGSTTTTTTTASSTTTTTLAGQSTTTTSVVGGVTTTTTGSNAGTTTTLLAGGTGTGGGSGSGGAAGDGSGSGTGSTGSTGDAPSSQLAATGASDLPEQMLLGASLAFGGLFILSFAYPPRRPRSLLARRR